MDTEQIYLQFQLLTGLEETEAESWKGLCEAAAQQLEPHILPDVDPDDSRLILAAAGQACYQYGLANGQMDANSISVGGISVSKQTDAGLNRLKALREELLAAAGELLDYGTGILRQVKE